MNAVQSEYDYAFHRNERRKTRLKRECDCGCVIDGGEPYEYEVWKYNGVSGIEQLIVCEPCITTRNGWYRAQ